MSQAETGMLSSGDARLYYEVAGSGPPFVMIHAGVADSRQWNREFERFSNDFRVVRYDMRGYGQSEPVAGEYTNLQDLTALLDSLDVHQPAVLMGCSMGGGMALDFALKQPSRVRALILVGAGPTGLVLDLPPLEKFADLEQAYDAGDLNRVAEIETEIWFDGMGRGPSQVNQEMRSLAHEMNRNALAHEAKGLGQRLKDAETPAVERLGELEIPVLIVVGAHDIPYIQAAADYMAANITAARKVVLEDAAHLTNMDHPDAFERAVGSFLSELDL